MKSNSRQPAIFLSHGGGPWPFVDIPFIPPGALAPLERYLRSMVTALPSKPNAALVVSAHWEEPVATLLTNPTPLCSTTTPDTSGRRTSCSGCPRRDVPGRSSDIAASARRLSHGDKFDSRIGCMGPSYPSWLLCQRQSYPSCRSRCSIRSTQRNTLRWAAHLRHCETKTYSSSAAATAITTCEALATRNPPSRAGSLTCGSPTR